VATSNKPTPKEKGVSIINKNLPSFGSDKQLEASIGKAGAYGKKECRRDAPAAIEAVAPLCEYALKNRERPD
jgi:hypothetical protein